MNVVRHATASALLDRAGAYLTEREAEHNIPLGILATLRDQPGTYIEPPYLATVSDGGRLALVAIQTPPFGVVLSEPGVQADRLQPAVDALVADLLAFSPDLPTALGPQATVEPFVDRWSLVTGRQARLEMAERIYRLTRVIAPRPAPGSWRLAGEGDRALLLDWLLAFHEEALPPGSPTVDIETSVDAWISGEHRLAYLWADGGRVVSLAGASARTPTGRRIGPVYTPPEERRRGYAGAVTAAASQDQLDRGARYCVLLTDLANPTSNAVYQRIGYEPVSDVDLYRFGSAPGTPAAG